MRRPTVVIGLDVPCDELARRIEVRTARMVAQGVVDEARSAYAGSISRTASKALGLEELATLPADDAAARLVARTRRYAAYQRKWMRRIPGLVLVDGTRPPEEVVRAILDLARAR
jgi:tRNA dimethylallyltransferase